MSLNHLALFNGIGGFQLAAKWVGWKNVAHVEIDEWCNKVTAKNFPESICHKDIYEFNGEKYNGTIDIISGGFPCQPFSVAGKRQGEADNRFLWFEMLRVIKEVQPEWVVAENVVGLVSMENGDTLRKILVSLENEGYTVEPFIIPASAVGAWHKRERIWIIANRTTFGLQTRTSNGKPQNKTEKRTGLDNKPKRPCNIGNDTNGNCLRVERTWPKQQTTRINEPVELHWWATEPGVGRVANGIPNRVDRIKGLGNAIVPQVALQIFKAISKSRVG